MDRVILHADVNNFYASVAIRNNDFLKDKPVIICGDPERRHGIVLAKSNVAKKAGIKTGDTVATAKKLCKDVICVPPDYKEYTRISNEIFNIYSRFTPLIESFGLDECWLDLTGCIPQGSDGYTIAEQIKETIKEEIGVTVSIGVSFTKVFAKLGSDMKKPDAITVIDRYNYKRLVWNLPVDDMLFIGSKVKKKLAEYEIRKIGDVVNAGKFFMSSKFGKVGEKIYEYASGTDNEKVGEYILENVPESISNGTTSQEDIVTEKSATSMVFSLAEVIAFRLRKHKLVAKGVGISVRNTEFEGFSKQQKLKDATSDSAIIGKAALEMLLQNCCITEGNPLRQVTVATYDLAPEETVAQRTIFDGRSQKELVVNKKLDVLRQKYGFNVLKKAVELDDTFICDSKEVDEDFLPFNKTKPKVEE